MALRACQIGCFAKFFPSLAVLLSCKVGVNFSALIILAVQMRLVHLRLSVNRQSSCRNCIYQYQHRYRYGFLSGKSRIFLFTQTRKNRIEKTTTFWSFHSATKYTLSFPFQQNRPKTTGQWEIISLTPYRNRHSREASINEEMKLKCAFMNLESAKADGGLPV